jgi:hypothetical protein
MTGKPLTTRRGASSPSSLKNIPGRAAGVEGLIAAAGRLIVETAAAGKGTGVVVRRLGEDFAYIFVSDLWRPLRFLRQMAGSPPVRLGTEGFRRDLIDDDNPARHYIAFLVVGYWLPRLAAIGVLWLWEVAGFMRYRGAWSWPDLASGYLGIHHGRLLRRYSALILPGLIAGELADEGFTTKAQHSEETAQSVSQTSHPRIRK